MSLNLTTQALGGAVVATLEGRLDAHGAHVVTEKMRELEEATLVVLDLEKLDYLSSAGVRLFVSLHKSVREREGRLIVAALQPYCRDVLKISGLDRMLDIVGTVREALASLPIANVARENAVGTFTFHAGSAEPGGIEVLGRIEDVLAARVTPERVWAKPFSAKEYSLGLGALGPSVEAVMPYMGEMMTIGGTMVWLPTDGNDTPDFLIPHAESETVLIRSGFNASIAGHFNEYVEFESAEAEGTTLTALYRALFDFAKERRADYHGAIGVAMRAEMGQVRGCGVLRSPVATHAPKNGKWITDSTNFREWFEFDEEPRLRDVTGLICGVGVDLGCDLSHFDRTHLEATFYINPANSGGETEKLHNHGVFFSPMPPVEKPVVFEREIRNVVEEGDFLDMRHLLDKTTVVRALIGVVYVQEFRADPASG